MALAQRSLHCATNFDGTSDLHYPNGDKPASGSATLTINLDAFTLANINLVNLPPGTSQSFNYRTFLAGSAAATATMSVNAASSTLGSWSISADGSSLTNPGTTGSGTLFVSATDNAGTVVNFPVQSWSIVSQSAGYKAFRGHYASNSNTKANLATDQAFMQTAQFTNFRGIQIEPYWGTLAGDTQNDPNPPGIALIRSYTNYVRSIGKKAMIKMSERAFGTPSVNGYPASHPGFPAYAVNNGWMIVPPANSGAGYQAIAALWLPAVAQDMANMWTKIGAAVDSDDALAMICPFEESAINWAGIGNHDTAWYQAIKTVFTALRAAFPTTLLRFMANGVDGDSVMLDLYDFFDSLGGVVIGGPDPEIPKPGQSYPLVVGGNYPTNFKANPCQAGFRGQQLIGTAPSWTSAAANYPDRRNKTLWCSENQQYGLGLTAGDVFSPHDIAINNATVQAAQFQVWATYTGSVTTYSFADVVTYVNSVNGDGLAPLPSGNWVTT